MVRFRLVPTVRFSRNVFQSQVQQHSALQQCQRFIMVGLQLRVESCPQCCKGGHYRDSANNFSNRLSQLLQTDALHCHGHSLSNGVMSLVTGMLATFGATSGRPRNRVIGISKAKGRSLAIRTHCIFHEYIEKQSIVKALSNKTNVVTNPQGSSLVSY